MDEHTIKEKIGKIRPQVIGVVITQRENEINLCPINFQAVSTIYEKPPSVCIGLDNSNYTLETILETKEFVYAYPSKNQLKDTIYCGTVSRHNVDKLNNTNFTFSPSKIIKPPILNNAVLNFECKLIHYINLGQFTIVVGEIKEIYSSDKTTLDKIYSLGGQKYGILKDFEILQEGRK
ncbi:hypothetical protein A3H80_01310 [Candidatus Roizmanbacteria bacterium RIFCSPLOWO2_02_FULL_37_19]|nr:MAG: hypothetical protein A3E10_00255 [Candidatus Roizmanbacteria bacterium RIFCSPHIGHO2_12_FULL_37_23]OGK54234.1 MAG: hypothetical protein A3H80_01310 [Candidatus Roizmanbacteria bacterium RIFCSPLOWO2_02_FULL_37_19]